MGKKLTKEIDDVGITVVLRAASPIFQNTLLLKNFILFMREDVIAENKDKKHEYAFLNINKSRSKLVSNMSNVKYDLA